MAKREVPQFTSLRQEREFWQAHDVFEVFGDQDWDLAEAAEVQVESVYVSRVDRRGATLRVPGEVLARMGAKPGSRVRARLVGRKTSDRAGLNPPTTLAPGHGTALDRKPEAEAALTRLRDLLKQERWAKDPQSQAFLAEAEGLLQPAPIEPKK